jgi:hypothetical protein
VASRNSGFAQVCYIEPNKLAEKKKLKRFKKSFEKHLHEYRYSQNTVLRKNFKEMK